jgi:hypothetical protein
VVHDPDHLGAPQCDRPRAPLSKRIHMSGNIYIYIYIYTTPMLSNHRLAQTQLVQPDCTTPHQLAQPDPHQPDHYINPRALILGFQPFCSTAAATETALSLSLIARMPPPDHPSERLDTGPPGAAPPYSMLLLRRSSSLSPIRFTPPSLSVSTLDLARSRITRSHQPSCPQTSSLTLIWYALQTPSTLTLDPD